MDVFYYWKDYAADIKTGRIGQFRSSKEKLSELQSGFPSYLWIFRTPRGRKGQLQLLARLLWSDKAIIPLKSSPDDSHIYYDPAHPESVWFYGSDSDAAIEVVSNWARCHFPSAVRSNFQGPNGQHAMRGSVITGLYELSDSFKTMQFQLAIALET